MSTSDERKDPTTPDEHRSTGDDVTKEQAAVGGESAPKPSPAPAPGTPHPPAPAAPPTVAGPSWQPAVADPAPGGTAPPTARSPLPPPADEEASARHAALRPTPVPPEPAAPGLPNRAPAREQSTTPPPGPSPIGAAPGAPAPTTPGVAASTTTTVMPPAGADQAPGTTAANDEVLFPDPNAPRTITVGTHVLGVVVGVVLPLAAAIVALLGNSRILAVEADGWVAEVEVLGIVLVTLGALLLFASALLTLWTPSVGLVGGALLTLVGGLAIYAPGITRRWVLDVLTSQTWEATVVQTVVSATSGLLVVAGVLLLASGIVSATARRHGVRLGAFRERHRA